MKTELWLLFVGIIIFIFPHTYLERKERQQFSQIKRGRSLPLMYVIIDNLLIVLLIGGLIFQARLKNSSIAGNLFIAYIGIDLLKTGLYATYTGKFPFRTRGGLEYFYVNYSDMFFKQDLLTYRKNITTRFLGRITAVISFIYLVISFLLLHM